MFGIQPFLANGAIHVMKILLLEISCRSFCYRTIYAFVEKKALCVLNIREFMEEIRIWSRQFKTCVQL